MSFPLHSLLAATALAIGYSISHTALDVVDSGPPAAIHIHEIQIWDDESTVYDRTTEDGEWLAWSGQILTSDGKGLICRGGGTSQYFGDGNPKDTKDVSWLVSPDCAGKMAAGQLYSFSWVPLDSAYKTVRFPETGYAVVQPASEK